MHTTSHTGLHALLVFALVIGILGCPSTGTDGGVDTIDSGNTIARVSVAEPPAPGTRLPEISETISHTVSYEIDDEYYTPGNTYRITGYFRATDSFIQVFQTTVTEQSDDSVGVSFAIPAGFPVTSTTVVPYRLFYQLTDETDGIFVLDECADLIYDDWVFAGTWYGIDFKTVASNSDFEAWSYNPTTDAYENGRKGPIQNIAGNALVMTFTHVWNGSSWDEPDPPEGGTIRYSLVGDRLTFATDEAMTEIFRLMSSEPTTYDEDYARKWWTGAVTLGDGDNGIILYMSDTEFRVRRDDQADYPIVEQGTVSASGSTLTLTVTHEAIPGTPDFFTPVDTGVVYTMEYSCATGGGEDPDTLTLTGPGGGDYASEGGITYKETT